MKLLFKLFLFFLIIFISYILLVFSGSSFADTIGKKFGLESFNSYIKTLKSKLDDKSTTDFYKKDLENAYNSTLSGANAIKDNIVGGINGVKKTVDDIREGVNSTVDTYEDVKGKIEDITKNIDETAKKIGEIRGTKTYSGTIKNKN